MSGTSVRARRRRAARVSGRWFTFAVRRIAALVVLLIALSFVVFSLLYLAPGGPEQALLGTRPATPALSAALREKYHLDESFLRQYWLWLRDAVLLDFGDSTRTGRSVSASLAERVGVSLFVGGYAFTLAMVTGVPLGVVAALRKRTVLDRGVVGLAVVGVSAPAFVTGVFLLYVFSVALGWFPGFGAGEGLADGLWHLTLPAAALALSVMALVLKLTRTAMIHALDQDYVAFARARGVPERRVIVRYALRNALVSVITAAGLVLTVVLTGSVLVEVTFALPGLGSLLVDAVENKDLPMLQGLMMVIATVIVLVNLAIDLLYTLVDPRVRIGSAA